MPVSDVTNQIMESLICPAPPTSHTELSSEMINDLIVPNPSKGECVWREAVHVEEREERRDGRKEGMDRGRGETERRGRTDEGVN